MRCTHCYQGSQLPPELSLDQLKVVLGQVESLMEQVAEERGGHMQIVVTGGEPYARRDLIDFLSCLAERRDLFEFSLLSNGTMITRQRAEELAELGVSWVQVSIEGARETHDKIRGAGQFDRAVAGLKELIRVGIPTLLSFTVTRQNAHEFPAVVELGRELGVDRVWSDRLIPSGSGSALRDLMLTPEETQAFFTTMRTCRENALQGPGHQVEVAMHRALQFLEGGGRPYRCTAGDSLMTILPNGDVMPCRRLSIVVGNVLKTPLDEIHRSHPLLLTMRDPDRVPEGCEPCFWKHLCRGGLSCLSHAVKGSPLVADPGCWLAHESAGK